MSCHLPWKSKEKDIGVGIVIKELELREAACWLVLQATFCYELQNESATSDDIGDMWLLSMENPHG